MNSKDIKTYSKCLNIEPIDVIEPYNPQIVEFENVDEFNIYYNTHKEEFNGMTTQKLNTKYKIPGYKFTKKSNELKLIKDYKFNNVSSRYSEAARVAASSSMNSEVDTFKATIDEYKRILNEFRERLTLLENQIEHITRFLSNI